MRAHTASAPRVGGDHAAPLRLLIPAEWAARIIGRKGARIQEVQSRSGAHMQLADRGDEKLLEVCGSCEHIDGAVALMLEDLSRPTKEQAEEAVASQKPLTLGALVPEALVGWVLGEHGRNPPLAVEDCSASLGGSFGDIERRATLHGSAKAVCKALRLLTGRLRRHARWAGAGASELPWEISDSREDGDPPDDYYSTENFLLVLSAYASEQLAGGTGHSSLLAQIEGDTGAALRVESGAHIEVAGSYRAKISALLELAALLTSWRPPVQLGSDAQVAGSDAPDGTRALELLLPTKVPSAMRGEQIKETVAAIGIEVSVKKRGDRLLVRFAGRREQCCAASVALGKALERKARAHEQVHGPPALLIDYLMRWCSRDVKRWPMGATSGIAEGGSAMPVAQLSSCRKLQQPRSALARPSAKNIPPPVESSPPALAEAVVVGPSLQAPTAPGRPTKRGKKDKVKTSKKRRFRKNLANPFRAEKEAGYSNPFRQDRQFAYLDDQELFTNPVIGEQGHGDVAQSGLADSTEVVEVSMQGLVDGYSDDSEDLLHMLTLDGTAHDPSDDEMAHEHPVASGETAPVVAAPESAEAHGGTEVVALARDEDPVVRKGGADDDSRGPGADLLDLIEERRQALLRKLAAREDMLSFRS